MSCVLRFLDQVTTLSNDRSPLTSTIQLQPFCEALRELDSLVGMEEVKEQIIRQLQHLLLRPNRRKPMLHSVMYGPPGVGKTRLGKCLAKLWTTSGIIKTSVIVENVTTGSSRREDNEKLKQIISQITSENKKAADKLREIRTRHVSKRIRSYSRSSRRYIDYDEWYDLHRSLKNLDATMQDTTKDIKQKEIDNNIVIAGRGDFVAEYVGQTVPKTLNFLNANQGKVIFIDEAYLLVTSADDTFGMEAITTINQYMDQHADKMIIIFGGYKEELQKSIFTHQKGLERRCRWVFEIKEYTPEQLSKIFMQQLKLDDWYIDPSIDLIQWFTSRKESFPAFGGDMESPSFYVGLCQTDEAWQSIFNNEVKLPSQMVRLSSLNAGYDKFLANRAMASERKEKTLSFPSMYS